MTKLVALKNKPPAVAEAVKIDFRPFDNLCRNMDMLVEVDRRLLRAKSNVYANCPISQLDEAEEALKEARSRRTTEIVKFSRKQLEIFDPDDALDDDGNLTSEVVADMVARLVGAFPHSKAHDPVIFTVTLIEEVRAVEGVTLPIIETAFRRLRRTMKFMPTIAEVLGAIEDAEKIWDKRYSALWSVADTAEQLEKKIGEVREQLRKRDDEKAKREPPFVSGDRVQSRSFKEWHRHKVGIVDTVMSPNDETHEQMYIVYFDAGGVDKIRERDLARLLPGDNGYDTQPPKEDVFG